MKDSKSINLITFILTYILARFIGKVTGFNYNLFSGININLLYDLLIWGALYFSFDWILNKYFAKRNNSSNND